MFEASEPIEGDCAGGGIHSALRPLFIPRLAASPGLIRLVSASARDTEAADVAQLTTASPPAVLARRRRGVCPRPSVSALSRSRQPLHPRSDSVYAIVCHGSGTRHHAAIDPTRGIQTPPPHPALWRSTGGRPSSLFILPACQLKGADG